jgi:hypothetical protein
MSTHDVCSVPHSNRPPQHAGTPTRQAECRQAQGIEEVGAQAAAIKAQLEFALVLGPLKLHPAVAALQHNYRCRRWQLAPCWYGCGGGGR